MDEIAIAFSSFAPAGDRVSGTSRTERLQQESLSAFAEQALGA